ncbi:sensor histidine kinase [Paractinoplanes rishiriensis]|uniref:histidine kinase n=1 Tax=Paractinoplanes rishiriensis TaxID=1050105 RepID=A0A919K7B5_9ACTN|nr:histidine kinase [Actinoplanes rishiriensis]GIF01399.1 hypothetical protein Ari01nite_88630 [Actinoplanes rishiriensis]
MNRTRRLTRRQLIALDGLAAAAYVLLFLPGATLRADVPSWLGAALMVAVGAGVALRRVYAVPAFTVATAASAAAWAAGVLNDPFLAAAYCLYPVAVAARRTVVSTAVMAVLAGLVLVGSAVGGTPPSGIGPGFGNVVLGVGLLAASWTAGRMVRERRADAARSATELAGRAVAEERLRIARELHDVVAHSMSLIAVKAGTANHVMAMRPEEAQDALRIIETTSRSALAEMRQLLGVLRAGPDPQASAPPGPAPPGPAPPGPAPPGPAPLGPAPSETTGALPAVAEPDPPGAAGLGVPGLGVPGLGVPGLGVPGLGGSWAAVFGLRPADLVPQPGMAGLPALAERAEQAGVPVELEVRGVDRLPEGVALSVYRIVQEALTNVVRHAAPASCRVAVVGDRDEVRVEVVDDGPGQRVLPATGRTGHGLIGMRERVLMYGGEFHAGPRVQGGFGVSARIPCEP